MKRSQQILPMQLDDLPGPRCMEALALLAFLRRCPLKWFVAGSKSARVAEDLALCGKLHVYPDTYRGHRIVRVVLAQGVVR